MSQEIKEAKKLIDNAKKIIVYTGAGVSTDSGILDYTHDSTSNLCERFSYDKYIFQPELRKQYWPNAHYTYDIFSNAKPNDGHYAIKRLEDKNKLHLLITQNIDRLHHLSGVSPNLILELNYNFFFVFCDKCGKMWKRNVIIEGIENGLFTNPPVCDNCGGIIRPFHRLLNDMLRRKSPEESHKYSLIESGDLFIALGTRFPFYKRIPIALKRKGVKLIFVNKGESPLDYIADIIIKDSISETLNKIID